MTDKILRMLVIIGLVAALIVGLQRVNIESSNNVVELVVDYQDYLQLETNLSEQEVLIHLVNLGIHQVALYDWKHEQVQLIAAVGLGFIPRIADVSQDLSTLNPNLLLIDDTVAVNELIGLPDTAVWGLIEFANLDNLMPYADASKSVRVHGISTKEMDQLPETRILNRLTRAVRERNIRVLYLRPFSDDPDFSRTTQLITTLKTELTNNGFSFGTATPFVDWQPADIFLWLIGLGVIAITFLFIQKWYRVSMIPFLVLLVIAAVVTGLGLISARTLMQQSLALVAAIIFPSLAIIHVMSTSIKKPISWRSYWLASLISLCGGIYIVGLLSGTEFLVKLVEFRGVKLMHIIPIGLTFVYAALYQQLPFSSWSEVKLQIRNWYNASIPVKYLIGAAVVVVLGAVYLLRTGNFGLPIADLEIVARDGIEQFLGVRPRTKEVLLGHPAWYFALATGKLQPLIMGLAVIGQLSLVNTFTHVHTPVLISILRGFYGLIFGLVVGRIVLFCYSRVKGRYTNDSRERVLRIR